MSDRRTGRGSLTPSGPRRPGQRGGAARGALRSRPQPDADLSEGRRFTGRAAVLVLVLAVLAVSYASSLKAYLQQRAHIAELKSQIAETSATIDDLEREKRRWNDDAYIQSQARERFGFVMPGQTSYVVLDEDGKPIESRASLNDPREVLASPPTAWWEDAWESVELAGDPPDVAPPPATNLAPAEQDPPSP